jgi:hypothetical protein
MLKAFYVRRVFLLAVPVLVGLTAAALLLAAAPARPAGAAAAPLAPAGCDNDDLEPNNTYTDATSLSLPAVFYNRQICNNPVPNDEDWYKVTLAAGQRVVIFAHFPHLVGDLDLFF